jgi:hypothetical protein
VSGDPDRSQVRLAELVGLADDVVAALGGAYEQWDGGGPLLKGLPGDRCNCPHWGLVQKGRITYRFDDYDEVFEAGDAFYLPPGHIPIAEAGTELLQFSPSLELEAVSAAMLANMRAMQSA